MPVQGLSGAAVSVWAEPGVADVVVTDSNTFVVWADQRRAQGLLTATQAPPLADLWLRALDAGTAPQLVCPGVSVAAVRLALTPSGRVGLLTRRDDALSLAVFDGARQFENGPCGLTLATGTQGRPALSATTEGFRVVFETDGGVFSLSVPQNGVRTPPRSMFGAGCTQPSVADTPDGSYTAALCSPGVLALRNGGLSDAITNEPTAAFTLVPELDGPQLVRVDGTGKLFFHLVASAAATTTRSPVSVRVPLAATKDQQALFGFEVGNGTQLMFGGQVVIVAGAPEALANQGSNGFVLTRAATGALRGTELLGVPGTLLAGLPETMSTARVLQRRPSVAWWEAAQRWLVVWEEATLPDVWVPRAALLQPAVTARSFTLPSGQKWPRVLRRPDGRLQVMMQSDGGTTLWLDSGDGGLGAPTPLPFVARGAVAGRTNTLVWSDNVSNQHFEFVTGVAGLATTSSNSEVSCATWVPTSDGGEFLMMRDTPNSHGLVRFPETEQPQGVVSLGPDQSCVSSGLDSARVALAFTRPGFIEVTALDGGVLAQVPADAGVRGLQLAPTATGWLVAYASRAGVFAAAVDDDGSPPRSYRLDQSGTEHGNPSVAAAPGGAVAVVWASLIQDSVELRLRVFEPADAGKVGDAGVDGGQLVDGGSGVDAGASDAGANDAGASDAGLVAADAGGAVEVFVPVCGCGSDGGAGALALTFVLMLVTRRSARRG